MSFPQLSLLVYFVLFVISNSAALPGETLITDFSDLYKNSLGYYQNDDGTLNVYQKLAGGGARFNFKPKTNTSDSYWYSKLIDGSKNQCTNGTGAIFRIIGADFKNNSLWFTFKVRPPKDMLCSATTWGLLVEKYFDASSFLNDEITGRDYIDIDLDSYNSDLWKLHHIAFVFKPNIDITIYSITLRYKQSTSSTVETTSSKSKSTSFTVQTTVTLLPLYSSYSTSLSSVTDALSESILDNLSASTFSTRISSISELSSVPITSSTDKTSSTLVDPSASSYSTSLSSITDSGTETNFFVSIAIYVAIGVLVLTLLILGIVSFRQRSRRMRDNAKSSALRLFAGKSLNDLHSASNPMLPYTAIVSNNGNNGSYIMSNYGVNSMANNGRVGMIVSERKTSSFKTDHSSNSENSTTISNFDAISVPGYLAVDLENDFEFSPDMQMHGSGGTAFILRAKIRSHQLIFKHGETDAAIKVIKGTDDNRSDSIRKNFLYEVAIMSALPNSPNIIRLIGYSNDPMAIVMKFYSFSLKALISKVDFAVTPEIIFKIAQDISCGLNVIHSSNILHLDVKPDNILIDIDANLTFNCVISDFGFANFIGDQRTLVSGMAKPTDIGVSIRYASPELILHARNATRFNQEKDKKIDVYAFAITIFEIVTQTVAWSGVPKDQILNSVLRGERPEIPESAAPTVSRFPSFVTLLHECWHQYDVSRPSFSEIQSRIERMSRDHKVPPSVTQSLCQSLTISSTSRSTTLLGS